MPLLSLSLRELRLSLVLLVWRLLLPDWLLLALVRLLPLPDFLSPPLLLSLLLLGRARLLSVLLRGRLVVARLLPLPDLLSSLSDRSWLVLVLLTGLLMLSWPLLLPGLLSPLLSLSLLGVDSMDEVEMVMSRVSWG